MQFNGTIPVNFPTIFSCFLICAAFLSKMKRCLAFVLGLLFLALIGESRCKVKKNELQKVVKHYKKCLARGYNFNLSCNSGYYLRALKGAMKKCSKRERKLMKCSYECEPGYQTLRLILDLQGQDY